MAFLSLYRKYRPRNFEDLVGQQHVVKTLKNALEQNRIAHAYLFAGPRGTGKTSTAKVFAQALNCVEGPTTEPCGECNSCLSIRSGQSVDVIEIDAASNRGIDEIRDLREKVKFYPTEGKYKVYIIDEVHMLTKGAFNALLKTLEEPPSNVVFILATTEAHKVIDTILSRCQRFDFTLLSSRDIIQRLEYICQEEKVNYDQEALSLITSASMGGLRDAISLLDQAISYTNANLSREAIEEMLGKVDLPFLSKFVEMVLARESTTILKMIGELIESGKTIPVFVKDLINFLHQVMLFKECGRDTSILNFTEEMFGYIEKIAGDLGTAWLIRFLEILTEVERQLPFADQPRIVLELGLIKVTASTGDNQVLELEKRIKRLEDQLEELSQRGLSIATGTEAGAVKATSPAKKGKAEEAAVTRMAAGQAREQTKKDASSNRPDAEKEARGNTASAEGDKKEFESIQERGAGLVPAHSIEEFKEKFWPLVLKEIKSKDISVHAILKDGLPVAIEGNHITIHFPYKFHKNSAEQQAALIQKTISQVCSFNYEPVFILEGEATKKKVNKASPSGAVPSAKREKPGQETVADKIIKAFNGKVIKVDYEVLKDKEKN